MPAPKDKNTKDESKPLKVNWLSQLFFWWVNGIVWYGYRGRLGTTEIPSLSGTDEIKALGEAAQIAYENARSVNKAKDRHTKRRLLMAVIWELFASSIVITGIIKLIQDCVVRIGTPLALAILIRYFNGDVDQTTGLAAAVAIICGQILGVLMEHSFFYRIEHLGMKIRICFSSLFYRKILKLKLSAATANSGRTMNMVANDLNRFDSIQHIHVLWVGVFQVIITVVILWHYFGVWCITGLAILFLHLPLQGFLGKAMTTLRMKIMTRTDARVQVMKEILQGIRAIKIYCCEAIFRLKAEAARGDELKIVKHVTWLRSLNWSLYYTSTKLSVFATVTAFVWFENYLSAESVFVAVALYNNIRVTVTLLYPCGIAQLADILIALERLQLFLEGDEVSKPEPVTTFLPPVILNEKNEKVSSNLAPAADAVEAISVTCKNFSVNWAPHEGIKAKDTVSIKRGNLVAIVGPVGSGKSTLLKALLQELPLSSGHVLVRGKASYAAQEPWIFNGSIRDNILSGNDYDEDRYRKVVEVCQLERDFELFGPDKDSAVVGDCGNSLSGGQRARINLARAVYRKADVYLLDDPLSAVDASVGSKIFHNCIQDFLKGSTRILVTHQLQFTTQADETYRVENGMIEFLESNDKSSTADGVAGSGPEKKTTSGVGSRVEASSNHGNVPEGMNDGTGNQSVPIRTYWRYLKSGASCFSLILLLLINILTQTLHTGSDYWLQLWCKHHQIVASRAQASQPLLLQARKNWTGEPVELALESVPETKWIDINMNDSQTEIVFYSIIIGSLFVFSLLRTLGFFRMCVSASSGLYNAALRSVVRAPMTFFETNTTGAIINRFTKDTDIMDDALPQTMFETIEICLNVIGIVTLVSIVNPYIVLSAVALSFVFCFIFIMYVRSARILKRLEANARSPIYSHVSSTLSGLVTIRAQSSESLVERSFNSFLDSHSSLWHLHIAMTRWVAMWLDWVCVVFVAVVITVLVMSGNVGGATAGMAISSVMYITNVLNWGVRQAATVETQMVSVERILEIANNESEGPLDSEPDKKPPADWPRQGQVTMDHVSLYAGESAILRDITLAIHSKQKIGVVGRTGAGKTSLINTLLRLVKPTGCIAIDGVDTSTIGLHDLRSKVSVIPQDPFLFRGTLRDNLCLKSSFSDAELWDALKSIGLATSLAGTTAGLSVEVRDGGDNFSVGQRQLVCLARAILQRNKILIMDEATSNVDLETDKLVQVALREEFKDCTVITIAHRLFTVMDCDKILVMDSGRLQEFDTPSVLLSNPESMLSSLVRQTGERTAEELRQIANQSSLKSSS